MRQPGGTRLLVVHEAVLGVVDRGSDHQAPVVVEEEDHGEPPACLGASAADPTTRLLLPDFETSPFTVSPTTRRCGP